MTKSGLKKLTIEVGGKKLDFTPDEAKELKNILSELFGADKTTHVHHYDYWRSYPYYTGSIPCTTTVYGCSNTEISSTLTNAQAWTGTRNNDSVTLTALSN